MMNFILEIQLLVHPVKNYYLTILEKKTLVRTLPFQAIPILLDKLKLLCSHLRRPAVSPDQKPRDRYILARDLALILVDFSTEIEALTLEE